MDKTLLRSEMWQRTVDRAQVHEKKLFALEARKTAFTFRLERAIWRSACRQRFRNKEKEASSRLTKLFNSGLSQNMKEIWGNIDDRAKTSELCKITQGRCYEAFLFVLRRLLIYVWFPNAMVGIFLKDHQYSEVIMLQASRWIDL